MSSEELQQAHAAAWQLLNALEEMLATRQPFICGDTFSVADVFTVPMLARLQWRNHGQQLRYIPQMYGLSALVLSLQHPLCPGLPGCVALFLHVPAALVYLCAEHAYLIRFHATQKEM